MRTVVFAIICFLMVFTGCSVVKKNGIKQSRKYKPRNIISLSKNQNPRFNKLYKEADLQYQERLIKDKEATDIANLNSLTTSGQMEVEKVIHFCDTSTASKTVAADFVGLTHDKNYGAYLFLKDKSGISEKQIPKNYKFLNKPIFSKDKVGKKKLVASRRIPSKRKFGSFSKLQIMGLTFFVLGVASFVVFIYLGSAVTFTFLGLYGIVAGTLFFIVGSLYRAKKLSFIWIKGALYTISIFVVMIFLLLFVGFELFGIFAFFGLLFLYLYLIFWLIKR